MIKRMVIALGLVVISSFGAPHFVLISAPGSGKGTFSQHLVHNHGYVQICPGDMFRSEIDAQTELGKRIKPIVEKGEYVDEGIVCHMIADHLLRLIDHGTPFIIDGFPRSTSSLEFLCKFLEQHNAGDSVVFLQMSASDQTCIDRIATRQICKQCSRVYNQHSMPPVQEHTCDACNVPLSRRAADTKEIAAHRLSYFHTHIEPLLPLVAERYCTYIIDAERPIEQLHALYDQLVKGV